jgi:hypothetical protein
MWLWCGTGVPSLTVIGCDKDDGFSQGQLWILNLPSVPQVLRTLPTVLIQDSSLSFSTCRWSPRPKPSSGNYKRYGTPSLAILPALQMSLLWRKVPSLLTQSRLTVWVVPVSTILAGVEDKGDISRGDHEDVTSTICLWRLVLLADSPTGMEPGRAEIFPAHVTELYQVSKNVPIHNKSYLYICAMNKSNWLLHG